MIPAYTLGQQAFNDGLNGVIGNPYEAGTDEWREWDEGFDQQRWAYCTELGGLTND